MKGLVKFFLPRKIASAWETLPENLPICRITFIKLISFAIFIFFSVVIFNQRSRIPIA
jgi:hypothetical protein